MHRRPVRITCLVVGLLSTAGLAYRAFHDETALTETRNTAAEFGREAGRTAELLRDLRASLHAYVAPGQGLAVWGKRAQEGIQALRKQLAGLDDGVSASGGLLKQSLDGVAQLEAAERRARTYASRDEMQLAGDVIFTEIRDVLAAISREVESIRSASARDHERRAAAIRQEQLLLAGGAVAIWMTVALLLLPGGTKPALQDPAAWRDELKETISKPEPTLAPQAPHALGSPQAPVASLSIGTLRVVSEICADLAALTDPGALQGALERVSGVLNATGLIVWVASNDGGALSPVATHGFDPKLVNRIGKITRDSANLTAAAFRDNAPKTSLPTTTAPAALAVPMCGPAGPAGVLSVELKPGQSIDEAQIALTAIVAAQLATLTMPIADPATLDSAVEARPPKAQSA